MINYILNNPLTFISILISIVMVIIALINCVKSCNLKQLFLILNEVPNLISEAEMLIGRGKGNLKLTYVKNAIKLLCLSKGIKINDDVIETIINEQVEMSKNVNVCGGIATDFKSEKNEVEDTASNNAINPIIN